ncbi:SusD/RagB family nutrient-binding outer membrane lipoprotein [Marinoscillum furvescens]|uniref:SusD/RagB-like outer membrane lipoprotein n=1 Tax=Marinoscillum furvescens DSM 4134 TaxID=1122208 RepID=A0A3D9KZQ2_MARFU|nr:SusD/RagB family nutrient-binding outer membrane lipoprotein [Marinoscillum furvescens]RED93605.1 SusD/RagB-like outer membrane lipoprotein [Marinoscillum furvescens DSM 4134]
MKNVSQKYIKTLFAALILLFSVGACTGDFEEINTSPLAVQADRANENLLFTRSIVYGALRYTEFQRAQQLYANHYIQYYSVAVPYFETGRYLTRNDWLTAYWTEAYSDFVMQAHQVIKLTDGNADKINKNSIARIWKVFMMHRITDLWGDVPYSEAFEGKLVPKYDTQEEIYTAMLTELEQAVAAFDPSKSLTFGAADVMFGSDIDSWTRFANSLRLRLAMRISDAAPALAEQHVRAVIADGRLLSSNDDSALVPYGKDKGNALENLQPMSIIRIFNEYRVSNTLLDYLEDHNDPRLPLYVAPAESNGAYTGLQNGLNPKQLSDLDLKDYSKDSEIVSNPYAPSVMLSYAEVEFLLAEAALKGWGDGNAQGHYEAGVRAAIEFWVTVYEDIKNRASAEELATYPEVTIDATDIDAYLAEPGIAYDPANALEQIITQKWLMNINQGFESYAEYRRTGFPVLNPIPNTDGLSETGGSDVPVRLKYPAEEQSLNADSYSEAVKQQGADLPTTRVWWDVD